jgi:hypothetical protein
MFGDFSNQAIYSDDTIKINELLNSYSSFMRFPPLKVNCRNTKKIAEQNTLLTGVELPEFTSRNHEGTSVSCKYPKTKDYPQDIIDVLLGIQKRGIPMSKVTLLSPKRIENSVLSENEFVLNMIEKGVQHSTIQAFKGLENVIIILYGFDDLTSIKMQRLLYVGISRATQELYMVFDKKLELSVKQLIGNNYERL